MCFSSKPLSAKCTDEHTQMMAGCVLYAYNNITYILSCNFFYVDRAFFKKKKVKIYTIAFTLHHLWLLYVYYIYIILIPKKFPYLIHHRVFEILSPCTMIFTAGVCTYLYYMHTTTFLVVSYAHI